jgi:hypothetical protein
MDVLGLAHADERHGNARRRSRELQRALRIGGDAGKL